MADDKASEEYTLRIEAQEVAKEVAFAVKSVSISEVLTNTDNLVHLNLQTKEDKKYCVELSVQGFRVVGNEFDTKSEKGTSRYYETIYSLLDNYSVGYRNTFGDTLLMKLQGLQEKQQEEGGDNPEINSGKRENSNGKGRQPRD